MDNTKSRTTELKTQLDRVNLPNIHWSRVHCIAQQLHPLGARSVQIQSFPFNLINSIRQDLIELYYSVSCETMVFIEGLSSGLCAQHLRMRLEKASGQSSGTIGRLPEAIP